MKLDTIGVVEAAYASTISDAEWLHGLASALHPMLHSGLGTTAWSYGADARGAAEVHEVAFVDMDPAVATGLLDATARSDGVAILAALRSGPVTTLSGISDEYRRGMQPGLEISGEIGARDVVFVNAWNPDGTGVCVTAGRTSAEPLHARFVARLGRISAHFASGLRLRRLPGGGAQPLDAEVVLSPRGELLHAAEDASATAPRTRDALRDAARAIDRARGKLRREDPDEALALWASLIHGRYTLVDSFDSDGRRFLVARPNAPAAKGAATLTARERQVLALRAAGHPAKLIAYELGLSEATISRELRTGMQKLGVRDALELARTYFGG